MTTAEPLRARAVLRELFVASRPVSWINTAYPFAAAYLMTTREIDAPLVIGTLFFLVPYNLAMYGINDVFDYESDLRNPRKGGAHGAVLDRRMHPITLWAAGLACLPFVVYLAAIGSPLSWLVLAISLFFVVFYSAPPLRLKERPFADSVTSSIHFFSPAVYGLVLAGAVWTWQLRRRHPRLRPVGRRIARVRCGSGCRSRPRSRHLVDRHRTRSAMDRLVRARLLRRRGAGHAR